MVWRGSRGLIFRAQCDLKSSRAAATQEDHSRRCPLGHCQSSPVGGWTKWSQVSFLTQEPKSSVCPANHHTAPPTPMPGPSKARQDLHTLLTKDLQGSPLERGSP